MILLIYLFKLNRIKFFNIFFIFYSDSVYKNLIYIKKHHNLSIIILFNNLKKIKEKLIHLIIINMKSHKKNIFYIIYNNK